MGGYGCYLVRWGRRESLIMASDWAGFSWREWVGLREVNRAYFFCFSTCCFFINFR